MTRVLTDKQRAATAAAAALARSQMTEATRASWDAYKQRHVVRRPQRGDESGESGD